MLALICSVVAMTSMQTSSQLKTWGEETLQTIRHDLYLPDRRLYGDSANVGEPPKQVAFDWGAGVTLSALAGAAREEKKFEPWLREYADATRSYWNPAPPVPGYDVLPGPKPVDRYYDDNEWMVMALVETYEVLRDPKYLQWAEEAMNYVLSGEDDKLGGGIYWRESDRGASKNTCSNAPAVAGMLAVYAHTHDEALLDHAKRIYAWTYRTLRDPEDGLMWDAIAADGHIGKMKWTYNTALMIRAAAALYAATKDSSYRDQAIAFEKASVAHWVDPDTGAIKDDAQFAHLLAEAWEYRQELAPGDPDDTSDVLKRALAFLHDHNRDSLGHYPKRWDMQPQEPVKHFELIHMASAARAYFRAARFFDERK